MQPSTTKIIHVRIPYKKVKNAKRKSLLGTVSGHSLASNQKPWMNAEVHLFLKARDAALRTGDMEAYSSARANLKGIWRAKYAYKLRIEDNFNNSDSRRMWKGIQALTAYKPHNSTPSTSSSSLPNELNHFYARFDRDNRETATKTIVPPGDQPLTLATSEVYTTLSRVG